MKEKNKMYLFGIFVICIFSWPFSAASKINSNTINVQQYPIFTPTYAERFNIVSLATSTGIDEHAFDEMPTMNFGLYETHLGIGTRNQIISNQYSTITETSIKASGSVGLSTNKFPDVTWVRAESASFFTLQFHITRPVFFIFIGEIKAQVKTEQGYIESRTAIRFSEDSTGKIILDRFISLDSGNESHPFFIQGILEPGSYYLDVWATGYFDMLGKPVPTTTALYSAYKMELFFHYK